MIPSTIFLGCLLSYCPTCQWRKLYCPFWEKNIFKFGKCICETSHVYHFIHYHKQIYGTFENNFFKYECKKCSKYHAIFLDENTTININCKNKKNQTSNKLTLRPLNRLSDNYCNRCNKSRMGLLCRGYVWFCIICKNNVVQFSCGRQVIIHNFYSTTPKGGRFHYCSTCKRLMLYYGELDKHSCCKHTSETCLH